MPCRRLCQPTCHVPPLHAQHPSPHVPNAACRTPPLQIPLAVANPPDACSPLTGVTRGSVIVVRPGNCGPLPKSRNVADAGAIGMIVVDQDGDSFTQQFNPVGPGQEKPAVNFPVSAIYWRHGDWIFGNASSSASMTLTRTLVSGWAA